MIFAVGLLVFLLLACGVGYTVREMNREYNRGSKKKLGTSGSDFISS